MEQAEFTRVEARALLFEKLCKGLTSRFIRFTHGVSLATTVHLNSAAQAPQLESHRIANMTVAATCRGTTGPRIELSPCGEMNLPTAIAPRLRLLHIDGKSVGLGEIPDVVRVAGDHQVASQNGPNHNGGIDYV